MKLRSLIVFAVLGLSAASAKTYQIVLDSTCKAGNATLKPGRYEVAVDASKVRFKNLNSGKSTEAEGRLENTEKKFQDTSINATKEGSANEIHEINLGGTNTKIVFE
jgi:hypothetical protein